MKKWQEYTTLHLIMIGRQLDLFGGPPKPPKNITVEEDALPDPVVTVEEERKAIPPLPASDIILNNENEQPKEEVVVHVQMPNNDFAAEESIVTLQNPPVNLENESVLLGEGFLETALEELDSVKVDAVSNDEESEPESSFDLNIQIEETDSAESNNAFIDDFPTEPDKDEIFTEEIEVVLKEEDFVEDVSVEDNDLMEEPALDESFSSVIDDLPAVLSQDEVIVTKEIETVLEETDIDEEQLERVELVPGIKEEFDDVEPHLYEEAFLATENIEIGNLPDELEGNEDGKVIIEHETLPIPNENIDLQDGAHSDNEEALQTLNIPADPALYSRQYYTMRETAAMFNVNQSLLRFWENEFDILKPKKNRKGDRYFRPDDIKNLELIYHLLKVRKFTIGGAKDYLKSRAKSLDTFEMVQRLEKLKQFLVELKTHL